MSDEERLMKLPVWAREEVRRLRQSLREARAEFQSLSEGKPTLIEIDPHRAMRQDGTAPMYIPDKYTVRFHVANGYVDADISDGVLRLCGQTDFTLQNEFAVLPSSSNVVEIRFLQAPSKEK